MNAQPTGRNLDDGFAVGIMSDLDSGDAQGKDYNHSGELHHATSKIYQKSRVRGLFCSGGCDTWVECHTSEGPHSLLCQRGVAWGSSVQSGQTCNMAWAIPWRLGDSM